MPSDAGNYVPPLQAKSLPAGLATTVNALLEKSERKVEQGVCQGMEAKKVIATRDNFSSSTNSKSLYIYDSKWNCNDIGEGSVTISVYKTDASTLGF